MTRVVWKEAVSFGLVQVPVVLHNRRHLAAAMVLTDRREQACR